MNKTTLLKPGNYYHVYNRGNAGEILFYRKENYMYFLRLYFKYMNPVLETYAWCLMPNHFHFLIRVNDDQSNVSRPFSNLFNTYAKTINRQEQRYGSLFQKPFKRIQINSEQYFLDLVLYIHTNPVHHGFVENLIDYPWTSYFSLLSGKPTKIQREKTIERFHDKMNFIYCHNEKNSFEKIKKLVGEKY